MVTEPAMATALGQVQKILFVGGFIAIATIRTPVFAKKLVFWHAVFAKFCSLDGAILGHFRDVMVSF